MNPSAYHKPYALATTDTDGVILVVPIPDEVAARYTQISRFRPASVEVLPTAYSFEFLARVTLATCGTGHFVGRTMHQYGVILDRFTINQLEQAEYLNLP